MHQNFLLDAPVKQGQKNWALGTTLQPLTDTVIGAQKRATCKELHQKLLLYAPVKQGNKNWALDTGGGAQNQQCSY